MTGAAALWWGVSFVSVVVLLVDWPHAPIDVTMHVGFLLITLFMGPVGVVLYLLTACEPLPGMHRAYIAARWKQVVGSTFHCVAGDSVGIVGAAVMASVVRVTMVWGILIEYAAGFLVGWLIFQSLFMKDMVGGAYGKAVRAMFFPEWLSMNGVMTGMAVVMVVWMHVHPSAGVPARPEFWFMMAMALIAGASVAYPLNWWLVAHGLKHGLMSTAPEPPAEESVRRSPHAPGVAHGHAAGHTGSVSVATVQTLPVAAVSLVLLLGALWVAVLV